MELKGNKIKNIIQVYCDEETKKTIIEASRVSTLSVASFCRQACINQARLILLNKNKVINGAGN